MKEFLTTVTRKGQITLPVQIRRSLGIEEGDKIAVSIADPEKSQVILEPVRPVAESTFGAVAPRQRPEDLDALRASFAEELAQRPIDFIDAYHAARAEQQDPPELYSYDADFDRVEGVRRVTP